jgi:hypothetical protein
VATICKVGQSVTLQLLCDEQHWNVFGCLLADSRNYHLGA